MRIDVLVSDSQNLSRSALAALIEQHKDFRVVGRVEKGIEALDFAELHRPDVVLISLEGGDGDAIPIAEKIAKLPGCRSMLLATTFPRSILRRAFAGGVGGIIRKSVPPRRFFEAIHQVCQGERVFDAEQTVAALRNGDCPLTLRELSILEHAAHGDTVTEIAAKMHLSEGTVRNYLSSVVTKLQARNRIDALRIARDLHWI